MKYAALILVTLLLSTGQILFKKAAVMADASFTATLFNGWTIAAIALYGLATGLWIWVLRTTPLNSAFPLLALSFILVPAAAWYLFGETLNWRYLIGSTLIVAGIVTIGQ
ncbi:MAG: hypothetical protein FJX44_00065 [Alphaproteobacteria bacterium]|nr:hypothetical protein [Alphaproteobacteria bacterium]